MNDRQNIEVFHLLFLDWLGRKANKADYALKGAAICVFSSGLSAIPRIWIWMWVMAARLETVLAGAEAGAVLGLLPAGARALLQT
jgi:hypothetical protein